MYHAVSKIGGGDILEVIPRAIGQSSGTLVLWDDNPEVGVFLPRATQLVSELNWGFGSLGQNPCLILYMFVAEQPVEFVLPRTLPTAPDQYVDVWHLFVTWPTDVLKLRYGDRLIDRAREVSLLLPTIEGENLIDKLTLFTKKSLHDLQTDTHNTQLEIIRIVEELLSSRAEQQEFNITEGGDDDAFGKP